MRHRIRQLLTATAGLLALAGAPHVATAGAAALPCTTYAAVSGSDANPGTQAAPFRSLEKLMQSLSAGQAGCLKPGDTFDGELVTIDPSRPAVVDYPWASRVSIVGSPGSPVVIQTTPGGASRAKIKGQLHFTTASHDIELRDIAFLGTGTTTKDTHLNIDGDRIAIRDSDVTSPGGVCIDVGAISAYQSADPGDPADGVVIDNNRIHNCGTDPNVVWTAQDSGAHGIYLVNTVNAVVTNNLVYDNQWRGIQSWPRGQGSLIANNVFDGNATNVNLGSALPDGFTGRRSTRSSGTTSSRMRHSGTPARTRPRCTATSRLTGRLRQPRHRQLHVHRRRDEELLGQPATRSPATRSPTPRTSTGRRRTSACLPVAPVSARAPLRSSPRRSAAAPSAGLLGDSHGRQRHVHGPCPSCRVLDVHRERAGRKRRRLRGQRRHGRDGGAGTDTVSYRNASQAVTVNLYQNAAWGGSLRLDDRLVGIENVEGSAFADTLVGDANANRLTGLGGNDLLYGEASPAFTTGATDVLDGGDGNDTLHGYVGNDTLDGGNGGDAIYGDAGVDTVTYASRGVALVVSLDGLANDGAAGEADNVSTDVENVIGGLAADRITGSSAANTLTGTAVTTRSPARPGTTSSTAATATTPSTATRATTSSTARAVTTSSTATRATTPLRRRRPDLSTGTPATTRSRAGTTSTRAPSAAPAPTAARRPPASTELRGQATERGGPSGRPFTGSLNPGHRLSRTGSAVARLPPHRLSGRGGEAPRGRGCASCRARARSCRASPPRAAPG